MAKLLDHEVDGIQEYDNPAPSWLVWLFNLSIVFAIGYSVAYPSTWFWKGTAGWSSSGQWEAQVASAKERYPDPSEIAFSGELPDDPGSLQIGAAVFKKRCAACHGDVGEGKIGPSLIDEEWLYGAEPDKIVESIAGGRPKGMPAWGKVLSSDEVRNVAGYVVSLGG